MFATVYPGYAHNVFRIHFFLALRLTLLIFAQFMNFDGIMIFLLSESLLVTGSYNKIIIS